MPPCRFASVVALGDLGPEIVKSYLPEVDARSGNGRKIKESHGFSMDFGSRSGQFETFPALFGRVSSGAHRLHAVYRV